MLYIKPFLIALGLVLFLIPFSRWLVHKLNFPAKRIPRWGGGVIILVFILVLLLTPELVIERPLKGVIIASLVILVVGIWDDIKKLKALPQFLTQIIVAFIIILAGVRIDYITNPFGGAIRLDQLQFTVYGLQFTALGSLFIILWIVGMINIMNWLDGIDGLAGGISIIGATTLFFLSISHLVNQPPIGILCMILAGATLGFLVYNFPPAKIFVGSSGSMFLGFMLGALAIFSGGKIATALLVMGFPVLDGFWVIIQRLKARVSPFKGDKRHLHYKLLNLGLTQRQIVLLLYFVCALFGAVALSVQTLGKLIAISCLVGLMITIAFLIIRHRRLADI